MFRTLVRTDTLAIDDRTYPVRYFEVRTLTGRAAIQRGDPAQPRRSHHPGRRLALESRGEGSASGAGDNLQQGAGERSHGRLSGVCRVGAAAG